MQEMQFPYPPFILLFYYINHCSQFKLRAMIALDEKLMGEDLLSVDKRKTCMYGLD
jgi:hypothetical protein